MKAVKLRVTVNIEGGRSWNGELVADERQCVALYNGVANGMEWQYELTTRTVVLTGPGMQA